MTIAFAPVRPGLLYRHQVERSLLVRKMLRVIERTAFSDKCWEFTGARTRSKPGMVGYGTIGLNRGAGNIRVHVLAHILVFGIPTGNVLHSCDNPPFWRPSHLLDGTARRSHDDARARGRWIPPPHRRGELNPSAKLTEAQVREIRSAYAKSLFTMDSLGRIFGVHPATIQLVVRRRRWKHVSD